MSLKKIAFVLGLDLYWLRYTFQIIWSVWESIYYMPSDAGYAEKCMMLTGYPKCLWSCVWDSHIRQILQRNMWDHVKYVLNLSILRKYTECNQDCSKWKHTFTHFMSKHFTHKMFKILWLLHYLQKSSVAWLEIDVILMTKSVSLNENVPHRKTKETSIVSP